MRKLFVRRTAGSAVLAAVTALPLGMLSATQAHADPLFKWVWSPSSQPTTISSKGYTTDAQWQGRVAADSDYYIDVAVKSPAGQVLWTEHVLNVNGITFTGKRPDGTDLPTGVYTMDATGVDPRTGAAEEASAQVAVQNDAPATVVSPAPGAVLTPNTHIDVKVDPTLSVFVNPIGCSGAEISLTPDPGTGDLVGTAPLANCAGTEKYYTFYVVWTDRYGHSQSYVVSQPVTYQLSRLDVTSDTPDVVQYVAPAYGELAHVDACIKQPSTTKADVRDSAGTVVAVLDAGTKRDAVGCNDTFGYTWDGKGSSGAQAAPGSYTIHVDVAGGAGQSAEIVRSITIEDLSVPTLVSPAPGAVLTGETRAVAQLPAGTTGTMRVDCKLGTADWLQQTDADPGTAAFTFGVNECTPGSNAVRAIVTVTDGSGSTHVWTSPWRDVTVAAPPVLSDLVTGYRDVYPAMGERIDASLRVGQSTSVTAVLTDAKGRVVDQRTERVSPESLYRYEFKPPHSGTYTLRITGSVNGVTSAPAAASFVVDARSVGHLQAPAATVHTTGKVAVTYVAGTSTGRLAAVEAQCTTVGHNEFPKVALPISHGRASGSIDVASTCPLDGSITVTAHFIDPNGQEHLQLHTIRVVLVQPPALATQTLSLAVGAAADLDLAGERRADTSYTIVRGTLPPGLSLNRQTGWITGTPKKPGTYVLTVRARNIAGTATGRVTLVVHPRS